MSLLGRTPGSMLVFSWEKRCPPIVSHPPAWGRQPPVGRVPTLPIEAHPVSSYRSPTSSLPFSWHFLQHCCCNTFIIKWKKPTNPKGPSSHLVFLPHSAQMFSKELALRIAVASSPASPFPWGSLMTVSLPLLHLPFFMGCHSPPPPRCPSSVVVWLLRTVVCN